MQKLDFLHGSIDSLTRCHLALDKMTWVWAILPLIGQNVPKVGNFFLKGVNFVPSIITFQTKITVLYFISCHLFLKQC